MPSSAPLNPLFPLFFSRATFVCCRSSKALGLAEICYVESLMTRRAVTHAYFFVRMRLFLLTLGTIDILFFFFLTEI